LVTMGLQREKAGRGSLAMYTQVILFSQRRRLPSLTVPSSLASVGNNHRTCAIPYADVVPVSGGNNHHSERGSLGCSECAYQCICDGILVLKTTETG
jgi:hypothetical protein